MGETYELKRLLATAYQGWINVAPTAPDPADIDRYSVSWTDLPAPRWPRLKDVPVARKGQHGAGAGGQPR